MPKARIFYPSQADADQARYIREIIRKSLLVLQQQPPPDTFLGRKTQEPFPEGEKD